MLFDCATDLLFDAIGIGRDYKRATNHGTFVAETHNLYEREALVGERLRVVTQVVGADSKRLHLAHEMFRIAGGERAATQELMFLSIDLGKRRVAPFLAAAQQRICGGGRSPCTSAATKLARPTHRNSTLSRLGRGVATQTGD